jgi:hypothetical protein
MTQRRKLWYTVKVESQVKPDVLEEYTSNLTLETPVNIVTLSGPWTGRPFAPPPRTRRAEPQASLSVVACLFYEKYHGLVRSLTYKHFRPATTTTLIAPPLLPLTSIQIWLPTFRQLQANCRPVSTRSRADKVRAHRIKHAYIIFIRANHFLSRANTQGTGDQPGLLPRTPPNRQHR